MEERLSPPRAAARRCVWATRCSARRLGLTDAPPPTGAPTRACRCDIDLFGVTRRVGFYSTFTARSPPADALPTAYGQTSSCPVRDGTGFVHALRGPGFAGVQFHPESVLTEHGPELLTELVTGVFTPAAVA